MNGIAVTEEPTNDYAYELETRNKIITTKQIGVSDFSFVVPRINWVKNTVYDMYDDTISLIDKQYYIITKDNLVYKCISNNYGAASTIEPTSTSTDLIKTSDGYIWKFMYVIPSALENKFTTQEFIPVLTSLNKQFYSNGTIVGFTIENPGSGYTTAPLTVSGDGYIEDNPYIIDDIKITDPGLGYVDSYAPPEISISAPTVISGDEVQATATAVMSEETGDEDSIGNITLTEAGYGYEDDATITVEEPISHDLEWAASAAVNTGDVVKHDNVFYEVSFDTGVSSGNLDTTAPSHTIGTQTNGDAYLEVIARTAILELDLVKTDAELEAVISNGEITNIIIVDGGVGYSFVNITVGGDGSGAVISSNLSIGDIDTLQSNVELFAVDGSIDYIKVENEGDDYSEAEVVIDGDGSGATAQPVISAGKIEAIEVLTRGSGYKKASVTITGNGTGATARPIISPPGGHGKNAISELGSKRLMIFTNISQERNQGFTVNNDYRQIGIIKSLKKFDIEKDYISLVGSACYKVEGNINPSQFLQDTTLTNQDGYQFIVVTADTGALLLQAVDNKVPKIGDIISNEDNNSFVITDINSPTIDKFSGDLMFIENRENFVPSLEQTITIKTVINF